MKTITNLFTAAVFVAAMAVRADYTAFDVISLNISNDSACTMAGTGSTATLAGTIPDAAWQNSVAEARWVSGDARNGYVTGVTAWNGAGQAVTNLEEVVFSWAVEGSGVANYGNNSNLSPAFRGAWLARASGEQTDAALVVQNIPYERYDVIVYLSGKASSGTSPAYRAVCVNGIPYAGEVTAANGTTKANAVTDNWGMQQDAYELGKNALKVTGLTGDMLALTMRKAGYLSGSANPQGIAAVQIVRDMAAIGEDTRAVSKTKVISVNLQSRYSGVGVKPAFYGLERVPGEAWTEDGMSNSSAFDVDLSVPVKEWDGTAETTTELSAVTVHLKANNGWNWKRDYVPMYNLVNAYLDDGGDRAQITVTGIPYRIYDVIVYTCTDTSDTKFGPVTVNGTPYRWSASNGATEQASGADSTAATRWGFSCARLPEYGANALRVEGQTASTLTIKGANNANGARGGIAGFQIVNAYDPASVETLEFADGDTFEVNAPITRALRVVCPGSLTIAGADGYVVTQSDLSYLDLDSVEGAITLGAHTCYALGASRALPNGFAFGEGSSVAISETIEEYAKDVFAVTGLAGVSYVELARFDGTTETLTVENGNATRGDGTQAKVTGVAALYDFTFTNTLATAAGSRKTATMNKDNEPVYEEAGDGIGVVAAACPYVSVTAMPSWSEFSTVMVAKMPSETKKVLISFGSTYSSKALFLATGEKMNEVLVGYGSTSSSEILTTMTVPNAAASRHVYGFELSEAKTKLTIYLDGIKWKTLVKADGFTLGVSSHAGIQAGSGYGGPPAGGYGRSNDGVFYALLIYDYAISSAQRALIGEMYPYSPVGGAFSRTVSGVEDLRTEVSTWTRSGDAAPAYSMPGVGSAVTVAASGDAVLNVNDSVMVESLSLGGEGAIILKRGGGVLSSSGLTTISTAVTIEEGAAEISGAPVVIGEGGSLVFDYSGFVLDGFTDDGHLIPLTGEMEEQPEGVVTCRVPEGRAARLNKASLVYTGGCYQLRVALDHSPSNVYLDAGATALDDDTMGTIDPEGENPVRCYVAAGDTVCFSAADSIVENRTYPVAGYDFGELAASVVINVAAGESVVNSQRFTGPSGKVVKTGAGTLALTTGNSASLDVRAGTLKLAHSGNYSFWNAADGLPSVAVANGAAFDVNGSQGYKAAVTLAEGAVWTNTGADLGDGMAQAHALTLEGNAYVVAASEFGVLANGWSVTTLDLAGHTLEKTGADKFFLCNCTISGAGTVKVSEGDLCLYNGVQAEGVTFDVAYGSTLKVRSLGDVAGGVTGAVFAGAGIVDLGTARPESPLVFAEESTLSLKVTLANYTEAEVRIPYTGSPGEVKVYEPDWSTECAGAKVKFENGYVVIGVDVASLTYANPANSDSATFTYVFTGVAGDDWENVLGWSKVENHRWKAYSNELAPALAGSVYDSVVFDGALMAEGQRSAHVDLLEGWTLRVGAFNGANVAIDRVKKQQGGCFYMVDDTSRLTLGVNTRAGNNGGAVDFYVAAAGGLVFTGDFDFTGCSPVRYSLSGAGSVAFEAGTTKGSQALVRVLKVPVGERGGARRRGVITKKLMAFNPNSANVAFDLSNVTVTSDTGVEMTRVEKTLTGGLADSVGEYTLSQEADGVYMRYIGYAENAMYPSMYIILR